jgi:hypothetical protein
MSAFLYTTFYALVLAYIALFCSAFANKIVTVLKPSDQGPVGADEQDGRCG